MISFNPHRIDSTVRSLTLHGTALLSHMIIDAATDSDFDHGYINAAMNERRKGRGERLTIIKGRGYKGFTQNNLHYSLARYMPFSESVEGLRRVLI